MARHSLHVDVEKIRKLANRKGLNISQLEQLAGLGNGTIGKWIKCQSSPRVNTLFHIAQILEVDFDELLIIESNKCKYGNVRQNEPEFVEQKISFNFCPMCGYKL